MTCEAPSGLFVTLILHAYSALALCIITISTTRDEIQISPKACLGGHLRFTRTYARIGKGYSVERVCVMPFFLPDGPVLNGRI